MNKNTLPFASISAEDHQIDTNEPLDVKNIKLSGAATMPPKFGSEADPFGVRKFCEEQASNSFVQR